MQRWSVFTDFHKLDLASPIFAGGHKVNTEDCITAKALIGWEGFLAAFSNYVWSHDQLLLGNHRVDRMM